MIDFFTWNRISGAVLGTALYVVGLRIGAEAIYHAYPPEQPAYIVEGLAEISSLAHPAAISPSAAPAAPSAPDEPVILPDREQTDFENALASANIGNGQMIAESCAFCHNWKEGDRNLIGPNLFSVVEGAKASVEGFNYSPALQSLSGTWTYADLSSFLEQPSAYAPGTMMAIAGIPDEQDRLDLIAFMRSWSDNAVPVSSQVLTPQTPAP